MDIADPIARAGLVTRAVEDVEVDGKAAKVVVATRTYPTSIEDLWDAVTSKERIPRWFLPVEGELAVGGRYQLVGNAGGEVLECEAPTRFRITWEMGEDVSWVTVTLTGAPGGDDATLELRHVAHPPEEFWGLFGPGAVGVGWDGALLGLDLHLASGGAAVDPEAFQAWVPSPDGVAFHAAASEGWATAGAPGDAELAARWSAAVTGFYTGAEPPEG